MGEATVASCVVFDDQGPVKSDYRRFNIEGVPAGDDYAAIKQAITRRYLRLKTEEAKLPDILLIDGGKGQLHQAEVVLEELQISGLPILAIAKGRERKPGLETLFLAGCEPALPQPENPLVLHIIQQIRDEAHRFAITGHRAKIEKRQKTSILENIDGIGAKRRRDLLNYFGGLQALKNASIADIAKVKGISLALAERIHRQLNQ